MKPFQSPKEMLDTHEPMFGGRAAMCRNCAALGGNVIRPAARRAQHPRRAPAGRTRPYNRHAGVIA